MGNFERCQAITEAWEGGWSDHARDPGGKTMYGITQATLSAWLGRPATATEIRNLSKEQARQIYRKNYWDRVAGDELPSGVDLCIYDFGVNSGPQRAVKSLQGALDLKADGWVGELTISAVKDADRRELINRLCDRRLAFLKDLETWDTFGKGWSNRVADIRKRALAMIGGGAQPRAPEVPSGGTAKALPAAPVEKSVSTEQKVGAGSLLGAGAILGFWRDYRDVLTDPAFLGLLLVLGAVAAFLLWRKAKPVEADG